MSLVGNLQCRVSAVRLPSNALQLLVIYDIMYSRLNTSVEYEFQPVKIPISCGIHENITIVE